MLNMGEPHTFDVGVAGPGAPVGCMCSMVFSGGEVNNYGIGLRWL